MKYIFLNNIKIKESKAEGQYLISPVVSPMKEILAKIDLKHLTTKQE